MNAGLGEYLRTLRNRANLSVDDLANVLELPASVWARIERNEINPENRVLLKAAGYFGLSEKKLLAECFKEKVFSETTNKYNRIEKSMLLKSNGLGMRRIDNIRNSSSALERVPYAAKFFRPPVDLDHALECVVYCKHHNLDRPFERILPDGGTQLIITFGETGREFIWKRDRSRIIHTALIGLRQIPITSRLLKTGVTIYVRFKPGGLFTVTGLDYSKVSWPAVYAEEVFNASFGSLLRRLIAHETPNEAAESVFQYFKNEARHGSQTGPLVRFFLEHSHLSLDEINKRTGYSSKYLTILFKRHTGMTPKLFQRVIRFNKVIEDMNSFKREIDWATLVYNHRYHDQAHFIKDFKEFSGWTPQEFLSMGAGCSKYVHFSEME
ncbi:helix-turn-helix domain-containing protein [Chryseolinea sp. H1M3-3]|uniref:helix-turn-helix domain-containing protein n=1 Tax=Chryseolinea sp. H1M3-3 TaxID=3034144 RepID=UPI0023EE2053|nr:helix-turn-helix domain-containing protein [Chryseolinea sp. H1M3-3]